MEYTVNVITTSLSKTTATCEDTTLPETGKTHIWGLEAVDNSCFAAVVETQTQDVHLLLQSQPSSQLVKQPHWLAVTICYSQWQQKQHRGKCLRQQLQLEEDTINHNQGHTLWGAHSIWGFDDFTHFVTSAVKAWSYIPRGVSRDIYTQPRWRKLSLRPAENKSQHQLAPAARW